MGQDLHTMRDAFPDQRGEYALSASQQIDECWIHATVMTSIVTNQRSNF
jgi:hypothetical protein